MDIHPAALDGRSRADIFSAVENARLTTHIGNAPTQIFIVGPDTTGVDLEMTAVVRHEDVFVLHAAPARPATRALLAEVVPPDPQTPAGTLPDYGTAADDYELTSAVIDRLSGEAEAGYDVDYLLTRTRPGRPAPMTVGAVVRVGLSQTDLTDAAAQAEAEGVTVEQFVADAVEMLLER
ncbi:hypothetical protein [Herbiconiux daphne]|uniref:DUF111 family protein n=1 Tax=Herbiconiux daphne TaxID=2970914 RepID=A0ABT2H6J2_9MICO|nr:hypothetical protein [Herbiconiux daphne]MCS5735560.1 hypothetical protein [Herbiconiux daphne]